MKPRLLILVVIALALGVFAYKQNSQERLPLEVLMPSRGAKFLEKLQVYTPDPTFENTLKSAVVQQDYEQLESLAKLYANQRNVSGKDAGNIRRFFDTLTESGTKKSRPSEIKFAEDWVVIHPRSSVAKVVHAKLLLKYAWDARGDGYANTVTREGGVLYIERLSKAHQLILSLPEEDQLLFSESLGVLISCAKGGGMSHPEFVKFYLQLAKLTPHCSELHYKAAHFSTQQWGGNPGEWEKNLRLAIAELPEDKAQQMYAATFYRMVNRGHWFGDNKNVFKSAGIDAEMLLSGLKSLVKNAAPESYAEVYYLNALAHALGEYRNDPVAGKGALKDAGWQYHLDVWYSEKNFDRYYREWLERRFR